MMDWEGRFRALVRTLVEIADAKDDDAMDDWTRVGCYDLVAHAHEKDIDLPTDGAKITPSMLDSKADLKALIDDSEQWTKEAMLAAEGAG